MQLSEEDIAEFIDLCEEEDGVRPSVETAREAATRVVLLYERLLLPLPDEVDAVRLAKSVERGRLSSGQAGPVANL